jgi:hypothetical protein
MLLQRPLDVRPPSSTDDHIYVTGNISALESGGRHSARQFHSVDSHSDTKVAFYSVENGLPAHGQIAYQYFVERLSCLGKDDEEDTRWSFLWTGACGTSTNRSDDWALL